MLQLHKTEGGTEYAEFLHAPRKKFSDFGMSHYGKKKLFFSMFSFLMPFIVQLQ